MDDFQPHPDTALPDAPLKGRGAAGNVDHRFAGTRRQAEDDGWWHDEAATPRTELLVDTAKSVITHNDSPDVGFSQSINPYRGCEHGCIYCYARPTHAYLGLSPGLDFETKIFHKPDAVRRLKSELARPDYVCATIALGTATDAYQPVERKLGLTRGILEVLARCRHPVGIVTKSALVTRDIDLLADMARDRLAHVAISLTSLDGEIARRLEPRASSPAARLEAMAKLAGAGIPVSVFVAPLIPGLTDHELEKLLAAARDNGAAYAHYTLLRLPHEVAGLFQQWLTHHAPEKAGRIMAILYDARGGKANDPQFGSRMTGLGHYADLFRQRFHLASRKLGFLPNWPELDSGRFTPPPADKKAGKAGADGQLDLF